MCSPNIIAEGLVDIFVRGWGVQGSRRADSYRNEDDSRRSEVGVL